MRIQVGNPSINWLTLQPQSDDKEVLLVEGESVRSVGMTSEEIVLIEATGKPALCRTQILRSDTLGDRSVKTIFFRETFLPHSHCDMTEAYQISITYQGNTVVGKKQLSGGDPILIEDEIDSSVFDSHSVEMVIRVLPLVDDYVAQIPIMGFYRHVPHSYLFGLLMQRSSVEVLVGRPTRKTKSPPIDTNRKETLQYDACLGTRL